MWFIVSQAKPTVNSSVLVFSNLWKTSPGFVSKKTHHNITTPQHVTPERVVGWLVIRPLTFVLLRGFSLFGWLHDLACLGRRFSTTKGMGKFQRCGGTWGQFLCDLFVCFGLSFVSFFLNRKTEIVKFLVMRGGSVTCNVWWHDRCTYTYVCLF